MRSSTGMIKKYGAGQAFIHGEEVAFIGRGVAAMLCCIAGLGPLLERQVNNKQVTCHVLLKIVSHFHSVACFLLGCTHKESLWKKVKRWVTTPANWSTKFLELSSRLFQ